MRKASVTIQCLASGWIGLVLLTGVGCQSGSAAPEPFTRASFQSEVLDKYALVIVGFVTADETQQAELASVEASVREVTRGKVPWISVFVTPDSWAKETLSIRSTPAVVAFHDGKELGRLVAPIRQLQLSEWLSEVKTKSAPPSKPTRVVEPIILTGENFNSTLKEHTTAVLVDFRADWCGPCRMIEPALKRIGADYEDRLVVGQLDIDSAREIARRYVDGGIPLLVLFRDGKEIDRVLGARPEEVIREWLDEHLRKANSGTAR